MKLGWRISRNGKKDKSSTISISGPDTNSFRRGIHVEENQGVLTVSPPSPSPCYAVSPSFSFFEDKYISYFS